MNTFDEDNAIKGALDAFIPPADEGYKKMISETVSELREKNKRAAGPKRRIWKPFAAAAAVIAALVITSAAVFASRPALAADLPVLSGIVYAAAPEKTASEADLERIEMLLYEVFRSFAACDYDSASHNFVGGSIADRESFLAAAYVDRLLTSGDMFPDGVDAEEIEIAALSAEQKAFRFTARVTLSLVSRDGARHGAEECSVMLRENSEGVRIESMRFETDGAEAYTMMYEETFGCVPSDGASPGVIPLDNRYLIFKQHFAESEGPRQIADRLARMLGELDGIPATAEEKAARSRLISAELGAAEAAVTPAMTSAEEVAAELMYRYWLGSMTGKESDLSDLVERNEETDLLIWDTRLRADMIRLRVLKPNISVEKGSAEMLDLLEETDELIKARFYVRTEITDGVSEGVGEEIILTLRKEANGFTVVGFDREVGDGFYLYSLKPLALKFMAEGYSWQEAGGKAYDECLAQLERDAGL